MEFKARLYSPLDTQGSSHHHPVPVSQNLQYLALMPKGGQGLDFRNEYVGWGLGAAQQEAGPAKSLPQASLLLPRPRTRDQTLNLAVTGRWAGR